MTIQELVIEMKLLERRLTLYEEKYGVLSEDFYRALMAGKLATYDEYDETRHDFSRWKGSYQIWLRRKQAYTRIDSGNSGVAWSKIMKLQKSCNCPQTI